MRSLSYGQVFMLGMTSVGFLNHVVLIPVILEKSQRDAWVAAIAAGLLFLLWTSVIAFIMRRTAQQPLFDWLAERFGQPVSWLFRIAFLLFLTMMGVVTLNDTTTWTKISYLPHTPYTLIAIMFCLSCLLAATYGIRTLALMNGLVLPLIVLFGFFVMSANFAHKDYSLLFPILEHGLAPIRDGFAVAGGGFAELLLILLFQHHIVRQVRWPFLLLIAVMLIGLTLGPLTGSLAEFGPAEASKHRYPAYEQWRLVRLGNYIEHVDFLSIYQWLAGAFIRLSLILVLSAECMPFAGSQQRQRKVWMLLLSFLFIAATLYPLSDTNYFAFLETYYFQISLFFLFSVSLILSALALAGGKRKEAAT
ncbi:MAG: endospore germination permease [Paenibacillaceae bacterium]|nr:endospore germination permease [Paenibacillaceae bacterium]